MEWKNISFTIAFLILILIYNIDKFHLPSALDSIVGPLVAFFMVAPLSFGLCWIGLPFSYLIRRACNKLNEKFESMLSKESRQMLKALENVTSIPGTTLKSLFYLFVFPAGIGGLILFGILHISLSKTSMFCIQALGLVYLYCYFLESFDEIFGFAYIPKKTEEVEEGLRLLTKRDFYIIGTLTISIFLLLKLFLFGESLLCYFISILGIIMSVILIIYGTRIKQNGKDHI